MHVAHTQDRVNQSAPIYCWAGSGLRGRLLGGAAGPGGTTWLRFDWRHRAKQIEKGKRSVRLTAAGVSSGLFLQSQNQIRRGKGAAGPMAKDSAEPYSFLQVWGFFCFPVTISSSAETCFCFSDCGKQRAAAVTAVAALPSGYCFGLNLFVSTLLAWPAGLIEFLIVSVSAANTRMKMVYSSKWDIVWEKLNAAATA